MWTNNNELFEDWIRGERGRRGGGGEEEREEMNVVGDIMFIVGGNNILFLRFPGSDF
jgi:hypothetical protein